MAGTDPRRPNGISAAVQRDVRAGLRREPARPHDSLLAASSKPVATRGEVVLLPPPRGHLVAPFWQPQRDSNPCRHLERATRAICRDRWYPYCLLTAIGPSVELSLVRSIAASRWANGWATSDAGSRVRQRRIAHANDPPPSSNFRLSSTSSSTSTTPAGPIDRSPAGPRPPSPIP